jgi:hypothetical protein
MHEALRLEKPVTEVFDIYLEGILGEVEECVVGCICRERGDV